MTSLRLVAPTAFKGTYRPLEAARLLARPEDRLLPLSDGGDGFLDCLESALGGQRRRLPAADTLGRRRPVPILELPDGTLAVECAQVIGLAELEVLDPWRASSRGLGELLKELASAPAIWVGLGGSATVDGGIDWPALQLPPTRVFCDVRTDLCEAAARFGPQKGAKPEDIPALEARLRSLGLPEGPHTGAAGGLGARLKALGASLEPGAQAMMAVLGFDKHCQEASEVLTGEGRLDATSLEGKLPVVVAQQARSLGVRVVGHFGALGEGWEAAAACFDEIRVGL